jgi:DNA-binding NtrC family response regulator
VLQDGSFTRLGATRASVTDARIISATNLDLHEAMAQQTFRSDLYYRLSGFTIEIPPLRERREEIPVLLRHFMTRFAGQFVRPSLPFSDELLQACVEYDWPGNLREMENLVKRYLILADEQLILEEMQRKLAMPSAVSKPAAAVRPAVRAAVAGGGGEQRDLKSLVRGLKDEAEAEVIAEVLEQARGVRKEAARMLNISYKALLYKLRMYGMDKPAEERRQRASAGSSQN